MDTPDTRAILVAILTVGDRLRVAIAHLNPDVYPDESPQEELEREADAILGSSREWWGKGGFGQAKYHPRT